jgi:hypothetical protein
MPWAKAVSEYGVVPEKFINYALDCNRLSGLLQSRHDDIAEDLREFVGRLGLSSSREG